jgi:hypothetical protein
MTCLSTQACARSALQPIAVEASVRTFGLGRSRSVEASARRYPIRKVTTPVPVEGGVEGDALTMSAGTPFHGRRKPHGSACQRRTMAGVQDERSTQ